MRDPGFIDSYDVELFIIPPSFRARYLREIQRCVLMPWKSLDQILDEFEHYSVQKKRKGRFDVLFPQAKTHRFRFWFEHHILYNSDAERNMARNTIVDTRGAKIACPEETARGRKRGTERVQPEIGSEAG
ncbi:hypothetical protein B0H13DRAFT_2270484 [Mycena leptocephala]|nr:hypothetical protein B0H13DRAFT_2270484 [Mycena leptocephala]